jgi:Na+-driven multidrug efflux pump
MRRLELNAVGWATVLASAFGLLILIWAYSRLRFGHDPAWDLYFLGMPWRLNWESP